MDIKEYINRIDYKGDLTPNLNVLKDLQRLHLLNVPFENLDIHYGNFIRLDIDRIYHKIVKKGRGGFCYELNGLFYNLLKTIGFESKMISAKVYDYRKKEFGKEFDHMAIIIKLKQQKYLVDVGFGDFAFYPLQLEIDKIQIDPKGNFIIEAHENGYYKVSKIEADIKSIEYIFTEKKRTLSEFTEMCNYHQTSTNSHFTQKKLISKPTETGRITLTENTLKVTESGIIITEANFNKKEFGKYLLEWFTIKELKTK